MTATLSIPDLVITIAYFSIPLQIVFALCRYPRLTKRGMAVTKIVILLILFAFFIFLCGAGHLMRCLRTDATDSVLFHTINILTAAVSLVTAIYLIPLMPALLDSLDRSLVDLEHTTKIVDSMYPLPVRERLLKSTRVASLRRCSLGEDSDADGGGEKATASSKRRLSGPGGPEPIATRMRDFLVGGGRRHCSSPDFDVGENTYSGGDKKAGYSAPIAESFPDSSILFADIVGFTPWSSAHSPNDVFTLLESLFWEFDEIAKELGVFKVCTIGDCYLAATGLHDPREDHALVLAQFAERCRRRTNEITQSLAMELGGDTADLSMRFGLHSGDVVAGVLRGQKSRIELFGDTVNTASRMESTGAADCIQASQETADLIRDGGKREWLVAREGLVDAKGKGELQTYWVRVGLPEDEECEHKISLSEPEKDNAHLSIGEGMPSTRMATIEQESDDESGDDFCVHTV